MDPVCRGCPRWDRDKTGADKAQGAGKDEKDKARQRDGLDGEWATVTRGGRHGGADEGGRGTRGC